MYTELIATMGILLVIFALCWYLEMRTLNKVRDGHFEYCARKEKEHRLELDRVRLHALDEGWENGRQYELTRKSRLRDKAGRFA